MFTGCVITETNDFVSSVFDTNNETLSGYMIGGGDGGTIQTDISSLSECQSRCFTEVTCNIWQFDQDDSQCSFFSDDSTCPRPRPLPRDDEMTMARAFQVSGPPT